MSTGHIVVSAPGNNSDEIYSLVGEVIGGSPGKASLVQHREGFTLEFMQLLADENGYIRSVAQQTTGASEAAIQSALDVHAGTIILPPVLSEVDKLQIEEAWKSYYIERDGQQKYYDNLGFPLMPEEVPVDPEWEKIQLEKNIARQILEEKRNYLRRTSGNS